MLLVVAGGAAVLQALGPPRLPSPAQAAAADQPNPGAEPAPPAKASAAPSEPAPAVAVSAPVQPVASASQPAARASIQPSTPAPLPAPGEARAEPATTVPGQPGAAAPSGWDGQVRGPDPMLLEPAPDFPDRKLPRLGPGGSAPMQAYARPFDRADPRPRIAVVMAGIGLSEAESRAAIETLPPAVDLAFSAYAEAPEALADLARARGHELLLSLPMEPQGYPMNDEGPHALLTGASLGENARNLEWALTRLEGYAGVTGASDGMQGERFAGMAEPFGAVARELATRGLFYVDARAGVPPAPGVAGRGADLVLDQPAARATIEAQLAKLERLARDKGSALGIAGPPHPVVVETVTAWARALEARGAVLAPASALARPAEGKP